VAWTALAQQVLALDEVNAEAEAPTKLLGQFVNAH
jgi:hypothetical protein